MVLQKIGSRSGAIGLTVAGLAAATSLGTATVAAASLQIAQQPQSSDEVIVPTEQPGSTTNPGTSTGTRFSCAFVNGQHTVMYNPESQPSQSYPWANPTALGGGWSPERRCAEISRRLESYRPDGLLEMRTTTENGYNTVCVTTQNVPGCRIVLTVPPGQDPISTRNRVFENLTIADSGQQTQAVNTYGGSGTDELLNQVGQVLKVDLPKARRARARSTAIDLRPFLDRADGGTATKLQAGTSKRSPRLNPDKFR
jgi:hypothetical protein